MGSEARESIEALLPHRPPFLFVDRVVEESPGAIVTEWDIHADLDCFRGHYPGEPVLPGVLMCEFAFQSGALLLYSASTEFHGAVGIPVLARIGDARFRKIVRPGETLRAAVRLDESVGPARFLSADVTSDGARVLKTRFVLSLAAATEEK